MWKWLALILNTIISSDNIFAHAMPAQLPWCVQNCDQTGSLQFKSEQNEFSQEFSYEMFPKWQ